MMDHLFPTGLMTGLVLVTATAVVSADVRDSALVDLELHPGGVLVGTLATTVPRATTRQPVTVFRGHHLVAQTVSGAQGSFRVDGLAGGVYWVCTQQVTGERTGRAVRAWAVGTSPPGAAQSLQLRTVQTVVPGFPTYSYSQPVPYSPYPLQAGAGVSGPYPFGPNSLGPYPTARMFFPDPIVAAAVAAGIAGVVVVANDDDDNDRGAGPASN